MARRNLTLKEKKAIAKTTPSLNLDNWIMYKKFRDHYVLKHKYTNTKRKIPIVS